VQIDSASPVNIFKVLDFASLEGINALVLPLLRAKLSSPPQRSTVGPSYQDLKLSTALAHAAAGSHEQLLGFFESTELGIQKEE
jgi:hypothetical protein